MKKIENAIDQFFDNISPALLMTSCILGIILIIIGIYVLLKKKKNLGTICILIGVVALINGLIQLL